MRDTVIYVSGALRGFGNDWKQHCNIERAWHVARALWRMGYTAICPHLNNLHMDGPDITADDFIAGDFVLIERSDALIVVPGWENSSGTKQEIEFARDLNIPVYFWPDIPARIYPRGDDPGPSQEVGTCGFGC